MTKQTNYIVTVTDVNQMLPPITTNPTNSNRAVIKDEVGQTAGSVGVVNNWQVDTTALPFSSYTSNRLPRFQDLVYKIYYCGDPNVINSYDGLAFYLYANVTVDSSVTTQVYFNWTSYDRPNIFDVYDSVGLRYTTGWVGYANYAGPWGASLNTATTGSQLITWLSTSGRYVSVAAGPADTSAPLSDTNTWNLTCITPTTTTTTSSTTSTTTTIAPVYYYNATRCHDSVNQIVYGGNSYYGTGVVVISGSTTYCYTIQNEVIPQAYNDTVGSSVPLGCVDPSCYVTPTTTTTTTTLPPTTTTTTTCNPTPNWVSNGAAYCDSCVSKQPQIDNNPCSSSYNQTQVINAGSACNTTQNWVNSGNYNCYSTCNKYNVEIQNNPCASGYNTTRQGSLVESNSTFCGGCCGQSTAANWVNTGSYSCYSTCNKYNVEQDNNICSPTYGQTQQGTLVESNSTFCGGCCGVSTTANWVNNGATFCSGCTLYQPQIDNNSCSSTYGNTRNVNLGTNDSCGSWPTSYYCIGCAYYSHEVNSCTGNIRNTILISSDSTSCGGCCGQSTSPSWVDNGGTFCDGCNLQQPQIDNNHCSATYGNTRNVDLGVTNACGVWVQSFYCVGYDKWSKETNSCTGNVQNQYLVEVNSAYCGYVPPPTCRTYQIVGYNTDEYVDGTYTNCGGGSDSFSFYGGPGTVGSVCAQPSTVYITSGNGQANDIGGC
jgi:hypothetical protein